MSNFEVKINQSIPSAYELFLFNRPEQLIHQKAEQSILFQLVADNLSYADFTMFVNGREAYSPLRAPFGSVQFHTNLDSASLEYFIDEILSFISIHPVEHLKVVNYPDCYSSSSEYLDELLIRKGFRIKVTEINYHLPVKDSYESHLHDSELRRLKKCEGSGFELKISKGEFLIQMFDQIRAIRNRKGFPLSMELGDLQKLFTQFPDDYFSFTIWDKNILLASAIGVRISSDIIYYFLPGDNEEYKSYSPTVQLIKGMYNFCQSNNYKILDLGISTSGGVRNEGLIRFKENLGAVASNKYTFEKEV